MKKSALFAAICVPAFLAAAPLAAKTLGGAGGVVGRLFGRG